ncbi:thiol-disulfide oxidoreductase DCC family protein [Paenibacillus antarcticus]|uniref:Thiol-disulfide oxidoreductase DCC n=1 Tax=Paenibacillus antarcticus TaxID=253703 RepID=A0A168QZ12_9BACL|nr:thiol-disulfide oxidoreductase DCC family protein [Paenibacillus antarcticus]OAB48377.1 thiol-disulfide oxidoreductase DCC [Paenibacillus antarcticus]
MEESNQDTIKNGSSITCPSSIVLIDGICNLCQGATKFIVRHDHGGKFHFASLQSHTGQTLLAEGGLPTDVINTIVLIQDGNYYTKSTAALRISRHLKFPWPLVYGLIIVPRAIRDAIYHYVALNRYRWFGKSDQCMLPSPELKERFLE